MDNVNEVDKFAPQAASQTNLHNSRRAHSIAPV